MNSMNLDQFRTALQSGGFRSVGVTGVGGLFFVTARPRSGKPITLATTRGKQVRSFRDPGKAIVMLHQIGAHKIDVDSSKWSPELATQEGRRRPDTARRQRRAHKAAAYDAWFRSEVAKALNEADNPATQFGSNAVVKALSANHQDRWRSMVARRK